MYVSSRHYGGRMVHSQHNRDEELLNQVRIAAPCHVDWESMTGDERKRFCGDCKLNVYNISSMSTKDAAKLIRQTEGRACLRLYRRKDGTIITDNCPVGLRKIRDRARKTAAAVAAYLVVAGLLSSQAQACDYSAQSSASGVIQPQTSAVTMGQMVSIRVAPSLLEQYGWLLNLAAVLSSIGLIVLTLLKKTRPSTMGLILLAIWAFTGFIVGISSGFTSFLPPSRTH